MARPGVIRWPAEYVERYTRAGLWRGTSLASWPWDWAERYGGRTALVDGDVLFTYADLAVGADALAESLLAAGVEPGDNIVVQLPNCWEFVVLLLACQRINVAPALALPADRDRELGGLVHRVGATALAVPATWRGYDHRALADRVAAAAAERGGRAPLVLVATDGGADAADLRAMARPADDEQARRATRARLDALPRDPEDAALFLLSGGTTAAPKLIPKTHDAYAYAVRTSARACGVDSGTVYLAALPIAHGFALGAPGVLGTLYGGGQVVLAPSPSPQTVFAMVKRFGVTITAATPAVVQRWLDAVGDGAVELSSLRLLQIGGAVLPRDTAERVEPTLGCRLQQVLGMSEGLICYTGPGDPPEVALGTQGRPMSPADEILIVDPDGAPVPAGTVGELLTRGPYTIRGYFGDAAVNARSFSPDGWYRTGDLVRDDGLGNLVVQGRIKDIVNRGGEKISAEEVESVLSALPQVTHAGVVAVPDARLGELVCLCAVLRPGAGLDLARVREFCAEAGLAAYKTPERLVILDALPLTPIGKIDKKRLAAMVAAGGAD